MSIPKDRAFYERRLREERTRAVTEVSEDLRALHDAWADLYEKRLETNQLQIEFSPENVRAPAAPA